MNAILTRVTAGAFLAGGLLVVLAGCNGSSSTPSTNGGNGTPPPRNSRVYVTNASGNVASSANPDTVDVFLISNVLGGTGSSISPVQQIMSGSFSAAFGVAVDASANVYVTDAGSSTVQVFHFNANGSAVAPFRTISSAAMKNPYGVAVDGSGNVFVTAQGSSSAGGSVLEFSPTQSGPVTPIRTITGAATRLAQPSGIAVKNGVVYVANAGSNTVLTFAAAANGNAAPSRVIGGSASLLNSPLGVAVGPSGAIYVANTGANTITVYGSAGTTPVRTITSTSSAPLLGPAGVALDGNGNLYVSENGTASTSNSPGGILAVYASNANGAAAPLVQVTNVGVAAWGVAVF